MSIRVLEYFSLNYGQIEVDFLNAFLDEDNYTFINPFLIRNSNDVFCINCQKYISSFMNELVSSLEHNKEKAVDLLSQCNEVNEVRLGMSVGMPRGKGLGLGDARKIVKVILESDAFKNAVINDVNDFGLFIKNIDKDKMSDLVANLIIEPLCSYTLSQCQLLGISTQKKPMKYWNIDNCSWEEKIFNLPVYENKAIILVPKNILLDNSILTFNRFLNIYVADYYRNKYVNEKRSFVKRTVLKNGVEKFSLSKQKAVEELKKEEAIIDKNFIARFAKENPDIFAKFKSDAAVKTRFKPDEIDYDDLVVIQKLLKEELETLKPGNDNSKKYQLIVARILELSFYPELSFPKIEYEINEGRKRIDISFNNSAKKGFFHILNKNYDIPSSNIYIECKNYNDDIANPELDQMIGRFDANYGKFGIICCRNLDDEALFFKREKDTKSQGQGYIIHFTDEDLINLLYHCTDEPYVNGFLESKLKHLVED